MASLKVSLSWVWLWHLALWPGATLRPSAKLWQLLQELFYNPKQSTNNIHILSLKSGAWCLFKKIFFDVEQGLKWITLMNSIHSGSQPCVIIKLLVCSPKVKHVVAKNKFNLNNIWHLRLQIIIFMLYALTYNLLFNHFSENWYNNTTYTMTTNIESTIFVILPRYGLLCWGNLTKCHNVCIIYKHVVMVHVAGSSTCFCFVWIACIAYFWFCASLTLPLSVLYPMFSYFMPAFSCYDCFAVGQGHGWNEVLMYNGRQFPCVLVTVWLIIFFNFHTYTM